MNKTLSSMLIVSAIASVGISAANADTSGSLTFTGAVANPTCIVEDLNKTVTLVEISTAELKKIP